MKNNVTALKTKTSNAPQTASTNQKAETQPINKQNTHLRLVDAEFQKQFLDIPLTEIKAGENWRKTFDSPDWKSFVENIRVNGVLEPILVAPKGADGLHEIIAGERRFRASLEADKKSIPARIMYLTDEQALDAHIAENLQRKDLEPLEEAEGIQRIIESATAKNITITFEELARRIGKSAEHIARRVQLNKLIPEAKADLRSGLMETRVAELLASYPEAQQKLIYEEYLYESDGWKNDKRVSDKFRPNNLSYIKSKIAQYITLDLANAPFSTVSDELRKDGLKCVDCKTRTGASTLLFPELEQQKQDLCMNRECFSQKFTKHVELVQITIARENLVSHQPIKKGEKPFEPKKTELKAEAQNVPLLTTYYYSNDERFISRDAYRLIEKKKERCEFSINGVIVDGDSESLGKTALICPKTSNCEKHFPKNEYSSSRTQKSPDDYKKNRQELFNLRADQATRNLIFKEAITKFNKDNPVWNDEIFRDLIIAQMAQNLDYSKKHRTSLIAETLGIEEKAFKGSYCSETDNEIFSIYNSISEMNQTVKQQLLLMLLVVSFGENKYESRNRKQTCVEFLAEHLKINYQLNQAEAMVDLCAEKYKKQLPEAKAFLEKVKVSKKPVDYPYFFFDLTPKDKNTDKNAEKKKGEQQQ